MTCAISCGSLFADWASGCYVRCGYANKIYFCHCVLFTATVTGYAGNVGFAYGKASVLGTY